MSTTARAAAHPNIAFIKYWGNLRDELRIPANGSISMNLGRLVTDTRVRFDSALDEDRVILNGTPLTGPGLDRVEHFLSLVRKRSGREEYAEVVSENSFPTGAGIASSASAFAALSLAASRAAGLKLSEQALSRLARRGSGSASRSVPGGFVEWQVGTSDQDSFAFTIAEPDHWQLWDCVAVVSETHKSTGSTAGHALAGTSPLQEARVSDAARRLNICRQAIQERDFEALAAVVEQDNHLMHAVMMTSQPPLIYWRPGTVEVMLAVRRWRKAGIPAFYTMDAGPNVHVLCGAAERDAVRQNLLDLPGVNKVLESPPGGGAYLLDPEGDGV